MVLEEEDKKTHICNKNMNYALFNFQPTNLKLLTYWWDFTLKWTPGNSMERLLSYQLSRSTKHPDAALKRGLGHLELNFKAPEVQFKQKKRLVDLKGKAVGADASMITNLGGK